MKITKNDLKRIILETLNEVEVEGDPTQLKARSMGASEFARSGMEARKGASAELTNSEQGVVDQVDEFLLNLAKQPGVDLNNSRLLIQQVMKLLQNRLGSAKENKG